MDLQNEKCVMVIDEQLPIRIIANTAAVMGITLGKAMPEVVCADVRDESGHTHLGIIEFRFCADRRRASRRCARSSTNRIFRR
mgnify:CR=1 FL=1